MDSNILMIRGFPQAINYWKAKTNKHDLKQNEKYKCRCTLDKQSCSSSRARSSTIHLCNVVNNHKVYISGGLNYENSVPMYTGASWYYFWSTQMDQVTAPARRGATGCTQLWCSPAAPPVVRGAGLPYGIVASCDVTLLELWRVWRTRHERMARPSHMLSIHIMS